MTITKTFVQEGFNRDLDTKWANVNMTYEEMLNMYNADLGKYAWLKVREIVKTFDDETFTVTEEVVREAQVTKHFDHDVKAWTNWYIKEV